MPDAPSKRPAVRLSELTDITVLYPGDLRDLGTFVANAFAAIDQRSTANNATGPTQSRQTLLGLARSYERLIVGINSDDIIAMLEQRGFDLAATVEPDVPPHGGALS